MAAVSETIVREYFELHGFLVRQERKHVPRTRQEGDGIDFFVWNPQPQPASGELAFQLSSETLRMVSRAVVVVRGWHTESFGPAMLERAPDLYRFVEPSIFQKAARQFSPDLPPLKILVVPALAHTEAGRDQAIKVLQAKGVDAVISFRTILADLIAHTAINRNYDKSDLLQIIRIFKNYDFFKTPQLELFRAGRRPASSRRPVKPA
ncbi:MAG TPA: hypothetical protein VHB20_05745 [Verrucomicrobiae bacterium]|jgi:hypothetical protein|nr:hypothetical protein [Verrucomicrobiae bacterium]